MDITEFYLGKVANPEGLYLHDMMKFTKFQMEAVHDYIQWMFPINSESNFNPDAPVLSKPQAFLFATDATLRKKMVDSFHKFIDFLDLREVEGMILLKEVGRPWWLQEFNHNFLRITRVLKSLILTGNVAEAEMLYDFLICKTNVWDGVSLKSIVGINSLRYWEHAMTANLWEEPS